MVKPTLLTTIAQSCGSSLTRMLTPSAQVRTQHPRDAILIFLSPEDNHISNNDGSMRSCLHVNSFVLETNVRGGSYFSRLVSPLGGTV